MHQFAGHKNLSVFFPQSKNCQGQVQTVDSVHVLFSAEEKAGQSESKGDLKNFRCKET
jgi:hypothetical protein